MDLHIAAVVAIVLVVSALVVSLAFCTGRGVSRKEKAELELSLKFYREFLRVSQSDSLTARESFLSRIEQAESDLLWRDYDKLVMAATDLVEECQQLEACEQGELVSLDQFR